MPRTRVRVIVAVATLVLAGSPATADEKKNTAPQKKAAPQGKLKAGWTTGALAEASSQCTEALVQGSWENTKREQGADPALPLTDEIRKKLEPQIASMKKLCACAVREGAKRYTLAEAEAGPADLERAVSESIEKGICEIEP